MSFTLDQLKVLDTIDRTGSFSAAARRLGRATSAVSYAVRGLEEAVALTLFDRSGHRAVLTEAGRALLSEGRDLLGRAAEVRHLAERLQAGWEPQIEVVVDGLLPLAPIMTALRRFTELGAPTRVRLRTEYLTGVRARFEADDADVMLALDFMGGAGLAARPMPRVEMILVAHRDHPLAAAEAVSRSELAAHVELIVEDSAPGAPPRGRLALDSPSVFRLSDFQSKRVALMSAVGFGWLPRHLLEPALSRGDLVELALAEGSRHVFEPRLVHRTGARHGPAARALVARLAEAVGDADPDRADVSRRSP